MARGRSSRGAAYRTRTGLPPAVAALGIAFVLGLVGAGGWFAFRQVRADAIDAVTLCPTEGATGTLAILLDLTDPLGATQSIGLRTRLEEMIVDSPRGTLIALGRRQRPSPGPRGGVRAVPADEWCRGRRLDAQPRAAR